MKKNELLQSVKVIILGLVLSLGVVYAFSATGVPSAPSNNVDGPLNDGTSSQVKNGGLSVNEFLAAGNSQFIQPVKVNSLVGGGNNKPLCADNCGNIVLCSGGNIVPCGSGNKGI